MHAHFHFSELLETLARPAELAYARRRSVWRNAPAEERVAIATQAHHAFQDPKIGALLEGVRADSSELTTSEYGFVERLHRLYHQSNLVPSELIGRDASITREAKLAWEVAKSESNFRLYVPTLTEQLAISREVATCLGASPSKPDSYYEVLARDRNPGFVATTFFPAVGTLLAALSEQLPDVRASGNGSAFAPGGEFPIANQLELSRYIGTQFGMERFVTIEQRQHTSCLVIDPQQMGIGLLLKSTDPLGLQIAGSGGLIGVVHELGHVLVHMHQTKWIRDSLPDVMMSQASAADEALAEVFGMMTVGSQGFWEWFQRVASRWLPAFGSVSPEQLYQAFWSTHANTQERNPLYRMILTCCRVETERHLLSGDVAPEDIAEFYHDLVHRWTGIRPAQDVDGIFGIVTLKTGNLAYQNNYIVGRMMASQLEMCRRQSDPDWEAELAKGDFSSIIEYLRPCYQMVHTTDIEDIVAYRTGYSSDPVHLLNFYREHLPTPKTL